MKLKGQIDEEMMFIGYELESGQTIKAPIIATYHNFGCDYCVLSYKQKVKGFKSTRLNGMIFLDSILSPNEGKVLRNIYAIVRAEAISRYLKDSAANSNKNASVNISQMISKNIIALLMAVETILENKKDEEIDIIEEISKEMGISEEKVKMIFDEILTMEVVKNEC